MKEVKQQIVDIIEDVLAREGCEIAEIKMSKYKNNSTLRLFVYSEGGVSLDQCEHLSHVVGDVIDASGLFADGYVLEVSSPGLDRPLNAARDFKYRLGETVTIQFVDHTQKSVTADIVAASSDSVLFRNETGEFRLDLDEIETARIVL